MKKNDTLKTEKNDIITPWHDFWRKFYKQKTALVAGIFFVILVLIAIFCYEIAPYGINEYDYSSCLKGPSANHWLGTDEFGRDLFSRILCGTRISLLVAFSSVTLAAIIGSLIGLISGYIGGTFDTITMSLCDVLYAFPGLILAIAIVAILGPGLTNVVIAVVIFRILGASRWRILTKHILPGALPSVIVQYSLSISGSIMTCASLSFLGMGAMPPTPEWGLILSNSRVYIFSSIHYALFPGIAILLTVLCFNLLGDGLRSALDPKLSEQ